MNKKRNLNKPQNQQLNIAGVISRYSNENTGYKVTIKPVIDGGYLVCVTQRFGRDGTSFVEKDIKSIKDKLTQIALNGL